MAKEQKLNVKGTELQIKVSEWFNGETRVTHLKFITKDGKEIRMSIFNDGEVLVHAAKQVTIFREKILESNECIEDLYFEAKLKEQI